MSDIAFLHQYVQAVCPIFGVNSDRQIHFKPEATPAQMDAALEIAANWNTLTLNFNKTEILANGLDTLSLTCPPHLSFLVRVYRFGSLTPLYSQMVVDGTLTLTSSEVGKFILEIVVDDASGYLVIEGV